MKVRLHVSPGAKRSEVIGWEEDPQGGRALKIRIAAPPVDGKANAALREFLAKQWRLPKSAVVIERGESSRFKTVSVPDECADRLPAAESKSAGVIEEPT